MLEEPIWRLIPILYPLAILGAVGIASAQAAADVLSLALAIPIIFIMQKNIRQAEASSPPQMPA